MRVPTQTTTATMLPNDLNPFVLNPEVTVSTPIGVYSTADLREEIVSLVAVWLLGRYSSSVVLGDALFFDFEKKAPDLALALLGANTLAVLLLLVFWLLDLDDLLPKIGFRSVGEEVGLRVGLRVGSSVSMTKNPSAVGARETVGFPVGISVGLIVGSSVGILLGARVGERVGSLVGSSVGKRVGYSVGYRVGYNVGNRVGLKVGLKVGLREGLLDGDLEGLDVGELVGDAVGGLVGDVVGALVGDVVGELVGLEVGPAVGEGVGFDVAQKSKIEQVRISSISYPVESLLTVQQSNRVGYVWNSSGEGAGKLEHTSALLRYQDLSEHNEGIMEGSRVGLGALGAEPQTLGSNLQKSMVTP